MTHPSPTLGHPVRSPEDAKALWCCYFGDRPLSTPSPRDWIEAQFRCRAETLALRLAELAAMESPTELFESWQRAGAEMRRLVADLMEVC